MPVGEEGLRYDAPHVVGIDLGGTATRFVRMSLAGDVLGRVIVATPPSRQHDEHGAFLLRNFLAIGSSGAIRAIGVGASGPIDHDGVIRNSDTLASFSDFDLKDRLRGLFGVGVVIDNDAVAAAVAEQRYGAALSAASLLHITLGTGIGTCLLIDGKPFRGSDGVHPEGGHLSVATPSPSCYCGRPGCWEQVASRGALEAAAELVCSDGRRGTSAVSEASELARRGDVEALRVFREYGERVGEGLSTLVGLYRPSLVVLGGSVANNFELIVTAIRGAVEPTSAWHAPFDLKASVLDDFGGAIGAAVLAVESL